MSVGIENLKKVVDLGIEIEKLTAHFIANGKNWPADLKDMFDHVPALVDDIRVLVAGGAQIPEEFKDLDATEAADLAAYVISKLTVDNAKAQIIIDKSFKLVIAAFELIVAIRA